MHLNAYIKGCCKGDQKAYKAFYEESFSYVHSIVYRYIFDRNNHKDVLQECYAKVFLNIKKYDPKKGDVKPWLRQIVVNECLMYLRKNKSIEIVDHEPIEFSNKHTMDSLDSLSRTEIEKILEEMPLGYKIVFLLHTLDGYSHKEIAKILNISVQGSRSQLSRAKNWILNHRKNTLLKEIHE